MEHLDQPPPPFFQYFSDAKIMHIGSFVPSLLWGGWGIIVPFYTVQDCSKVDYIFTGLQCENNSVFVFKFGILQIICNY